jgi:hypothetical protein
MAISKPKQLTVVNTDGRATTRGGSTSVTRVSSGGGTIGSSGLTSAELTSLISQVLNDNYNVIRKGLEKYFLSKVSDDEAAGQIKFKEGALYGDFVTGTAGGSFTVDNETGLSSIEVDKLWVRMKAFFETLEIVNVNSIGGKQILSPGGAQKISYVAQHGEEDELTASIRGENDDKDFVVDVQEIPENTYRCFFLAEQDGQEVENRFEAGDQIMSKDFNIRKPGEYNQVTNHYYWRLCTAVSEEPVQLGTNKYHWFDLSVSDCQADSDAPATGDVAAQLGNREDTDRQNAIVISAVDSFSPSITMYAGLNSYSYAKKDYLSFYVDKSTHKAKADIYGETYIGDRDGKYYFKFTESGGVEVKGKITSSSTIFDENSEDGEETDLYNYIKDISDSGVKEAKDALDEDIKTLKGSINDTDDTVSSLQQFTDKAFADGIVNRAEAAAIKGYLTDMETTLSDVGKAYSSVYNNSLLDDEKTKKNLDDAYNAFIKASENLEKNINATIEDGIATDGERSALQDYYDTYNTAYGDFVYYLNQANNYVFDKLDKEYGTVKGLVDKLDYLKAALKEKTTTEGGLILSSIISLGYHNDDWTTQTTYAGLSGVYNTDTATHRGHGISYWSGGDMIDIFDYYKDGEFNVPSDVRPAASVDRMDGSGYRANGHLWWDTSGNVHADPLTFFVGEAQVGNLLASFDCTDTYITPTKPFTHIQVGECYLRYDIAKKALYLEGPNDEDGNPIDVNFYTGGEVVAGGGDFNADGGGGNVSFNLLTSWTQDWDTTYALGAALAIELHNSLNTLSTKVENIKTNVGVSVNNGSVVYPNDNDVIALTVDEYTPTAATSGALGCIKIGYTTSAANRKYAVELDSSNKAFVNVPWTDTTYTLSAATSSALGGIKIGYTESGRNYAVKLDSSNKAYVNVPWTDTTYTSLKNPYSLKFDGDSAKSYDGSSEVKVTAAMVGALASDGKAKSAGTADSATTAGQLTNSHTFWGQSFNGTQDVSGALSSVTTISASGNITTSGEVTAGSDIRYKDIQHDCSLPLASIAGAPLFNFKWKGERDDGREHIGTSAQYWREYAPEFVSGDEDFLQLNYGALGVAMGISNARAIQSVHEQVMEMARSLQRLTEENKRLSEELEYIRKGGQR